MPNLFDPQDVKHLIARINKLTPQYAGAWGKMTVGQMVKHLQIPLQVITGEHTLQVNFFLKLFGPLLIGGVSGPKPFSKNSFTPFPVNDFPDFATERAKLVGILKRVSEAGPVASMRIPNPIFGKLTSDQISAIQMKHFEHHLGQFGV